MLVSPVKERLRVIPVAQFPFHVQDMHANRDSKFEVEYEVMPHPLFVLAW